MEEISASFNSEAEVPSTKNPEQDRKISERGHFGKFSINAVVKRTSRNVLTTE